jgi:hypothetical protein
MTIRSAMRPLLLNVRASESKAKATATAGHGHPFEARSRGV